MAKTQVNLYIDDSWKKTLEQIARERSYKENRTISLLDLIRETLDKNYNLSKKEVVNNESKN